MFSNNLLLHGEQVVLKLFTEKNITEEYLAWLNNKDIVRYSNQRFIQHTVATSRQYLASFSGANNLFLAVYCNNILVGTMTAYVSSEHKVADMGIMIGRSAWSKGYGLDAWQTLMHFLFDQGMRKVTGGTLRCNKAMLKIMQKSNMHADGVRVAQEIIEGNPVDILYFSKFKEAA
jgi:RimJ/RimL family protein N-acetyltransferase